MPTKTLMRLLAVVAAFSIVAAACGDDDDEGAVGPADCELNEVDGDLAIFNWAEYLDPEELDAFAAELFDRFGPLPDEAENLLETIALKALCRQAGVEKLEAGPKGAVVSFHKMNFANPPGLVDFLTAQNGTARLRPDHKLVFMRNWQTASERFDGVRYLMKELASIAAG